MGKSKKVEKIVEEVEETKSPETNTETQTEESPVVVTESIEEDIAGGGPKNPPKKEGEGLVIETVDINEGAEGDAGQESINDIDVEFDEVAAEEDIYVSAYIKIANALTDLKHVRDNDISIEKNEDLDVAILYSEKAIESIEKLRGEKLLE